MFAITLASTATVQPPTAFSSEQWDALDELAQSNPTLAALLDAARDAEAQLNGLCETGLSYLDAAENCQENAERCHSRMKSLAGVLAGYLG